VRRPDSWTDIVNEKLPTPAYDALRTAAQRQIPFGDPDWIRFVKQQKKGLPSQEDRAVEETRIALT
jgi:hypothetical protein